MNQSQKEYFRAKHDVLILQFFQNRMHPCNLPTISQLEFPFNPGVRHKSQINVGELILSLAPLLIWCPPSPFTALINVLASAKLQPPYCGEEPHATPHDKSSSLARLNDGQMTQNGVLILHSRALCACVRTQ